MHTARTGIAVWLRSTKNVRHLRRYGVVYYVSKRFKYAVLYCNQSEADQTIEKIEALSFVEKVEKSRKPEVRTEFSGPIKPKEKENDYHYNAGI
ncbi:YlbG family protein [Salibacterium sp. K-3]